MQTMFADNLLHLLLGFQLLCDVTLQPFVDNTGSILHQLKCTDSCADREREKREKVHVLQQQC